MIKKFQLGFSPIIIIILLAIIAGSSVVIIKNIPFNQPQPVLAPEKPSTSSAQLQATPSATLTKTSTLTSKKPTLAPTKTPTSAPFNNSSNNNSSSPTPTNIPTLAPTSVPSSTSTPTPAASLELFSVDKTSVNVIIIRNGKTVGRLFGAYPSGVKITNNSGSGYVLQGEVGQSGVGLETVGNSVGMLPGQSQYLAPFITADHQNGTYTGTNTFVYYDSQSQSYPGASVSYTITLTD